MIDGDHLLNPMQLDRRREIIPKCLMPILERRRDDTDRRAGDDELAEFSGQVLLDRVPMHGLLHARIDAGQNHRLVAAFGRKHEVWREGHRRAAYYKGTDEAPAIEYGPQAAAARARFLMQSCHDPSLCDDAPRVSFADGVSRAHDHRRRAVSQARTAVAILNLTGGLPTCLPARRTRSAGRGQGILLTYVNYGLWPLSS